MLKSLNPRAHFIAGEQIRVPNVLDAGRLASNTASAAGTDGKRIRGKVEAAKVFVSRKASDLKVHGREGQIIFYARVTSGGEHVSFPIGNWVATSVVRNPIYNYNPDLFRKADSANAQAKIAARSEQSRRRCPDRGNVPNYGIHDTPETGEIGHSASYRCVRMINWGVADLIKDGTPLVFEEKP